MPVRKMKKFLDKHHVRYVTVLHSPAYTAQAEAASAHLPAQEIAKTVMIEVDGKMAMAVLPASEQIEFSLLREALKAKSVKLLHETDFRGRFPGCEPGAMPPFGNLYGMPVFVSRTLADDKNIAFMAGSHRETIMMPYADYERLVHPKMLNFSAEILALGSR